MEWLAIDAGNSRIKWRLGQQQTIIDQGVFTHHYNPEQGQWPAMTPKRIVISHVWGHSAHQTWLEYCQRTWQKTPLLLTPKTRQYGITTAYQHPERLGADRYAGLIASFGLGFAPCAVVNCGTAITLDWLAADGYHQGGLIWPGFTTMSQALHQGTRQLPQILRGGDCQLLAGTTTEQAMQQGIYLTNSYAVRSLLNAKQQHESQPLQLIVTGGDGQLLCESLTDLDPIYRPQLVLDGLQRVVQSIS